MGKDWAVFKLKPNSVTGLMPGEAQGHYQLYNGDVKTGEIIRITGYGRDTNDTDRNFSQQTHFGSVDSLEEITLYFFESGFSMI